MNILLIGASGVIGGAVHSALSEEHDVITANKTSGDFTVDIGDSDSIRALFEAAGPLDAIICVAGNAEVRPLGDLTDADFDRAANVQLMGQINLFRFARASLRTGGSVTLTSGAASHAPIPGTAAISMACAGLERFVSAASVELEDLRLNVVSPIFVKETMAQMGMPTDGGLSAADTAKAYVAAVHGTMHGRTLIAPEYL